ncbi:hypothetical protein PT974_10331 [Cladobotryum mycophilum]|uniref:Uncharacterized protein n=1 Tax=Cladobotryum mycophilum TaxID=491253 RepID=A0ABR0S9J7_9HYPO
MSDQSVTKSLASSQSIEDDIVKGASFLFDVINGTLDVLEGPEGSKALEAFLDLFDIWLQEADLTFRTNVEASLDDLPELLDFILGPDGQDSLSASHPSDPVTSAPGSTDYDTSDGVREVATKSDNAAVVFGGAPIENLCLVVSDKSGKRFSDVPVIPTLCSSDVLAHLIVPMPEIIRGEQGSKLPAFKLALPGEDILLPRAEDAPSPVQEHVPSIGVTDLKVPEKSVSEEEKRAATHKDGQLIVEENENGQKLLNTELDSYVLSGNINNFFGIKGLKAKIYKFKLPGDKKSGSDAASEGDEEESNKSTSGENNEPTREKVKLNTKAMALAGEPLGTLFPFLEDVTIRKLPIENLAFTYSEAEEDEFFAPGLRLEADLLLKDDIQWAADALKNLFGNRKPPTRIHLSAHIADERDWSKRPKISKLILQGYFESIDVEAWDFLQFKNVGLEISATKDSNPSDGSNDEDGTDKNESETSDTEVDAEEEAGLKTVSNDSVSDKTQSRDESVDSEDEKKPEDSKKKGSWKFDMAFFGSVQITGIPHANLPLELKYRLSREHVSEDEGTESNDEDEDEDEDGEEKEEEEKKGDKKKGKENDENADKKTNKTSKKVIKKSKTEKNKDLQKTAKKKDSKDTKSKRSWNLAIISGEWEDIYGIKNVTMSDVEFKASFTEGDFKKTMKLHLSANLTLGSGSFKVEGQISKNDSFLDAEVGDLTLSDLKKIHAQIAGQKIPEDDQKSDTDIGGNELVFKKIHFNLSSKKSEEDLKTIRALQLDGHVTFNGNTSAKANLRIANDGLTIQGSLTDFKIPETSVTIKKAGLDIFIGFGSNSKARKKDGKAIEDVQSDEDEEKTSTKERTSTKVKTSKNKKFSKRRSRNVTTVAKKKPAHDDKPVDFKDKSKKGKTGNRGQNRFGIVGEVQIEKIVVSVGFYTEKKKDKKKRDWLAFGAIRSITLSEVWPSLKGTFLDLKLDNVALIASSEDREQKNLEDSPGDGDDTHWGVLEEVDSYNYPIVRGIQLAATISSFEQLEHLNNKDKIDGLVLIFSYTLEGRPKVSINIPKRISIPLRKFATIGDFGAAVSLEGGNPELSLTATLTMLFDDQDPIEVQGVRGELFMKSGSKWINPFKLNEAVVISGVGIGTGFDYATVMARGPNSLKLSGSLKINDDVKGDIAISVSTVSTEQLFDLKISELDISALVRTAGEMSKNVQLQSLQDSKKLLVFTDIKIYFSTGVAGLDHFKIGDLEVTSAREYDGVKRVILDVEMTSEKQKIYVDGIIRYFDAELALLIDANLSEKKLYAKIIVKFTDNLSIFLEADGQFDDSEGLGGLMGRLRAELRPDVFGAIFDGINQGIETLGKLAIQAIEEAERDLKQGLQRNEDELRKAKSKLDKIKLDSDAELARQKHRLEEERKARSQASDELDKLKKAVSDARASKTKNDKEIARLKRMEEKATDKWSKNMREKGHEYRKKIRHQKTKQQVWAQERRRLEAARDAKWGDALRDGEAKRVIMAASQGLINIHWAEIENLKKQRDAGPFWKVPILNIQMTGIEFEIKKIQLLNLGVVGVIDTANSIMALPAFKEFESGIQDASEKMVQFGNALTALESRGLSGYLEEMCKNDRKELQNYINTIRKLEAKSKELEGVLRAALAELEKNQGRLSRAEKEAQDKIAVLERDMKVMPFEDAYKSQKRKYEGITTQIRMAQEALKDLKNEVKAGTESAKAIVNELKNGIPRVTRILVIANTEMFTKKEPLVFEMDVEWAGKTTTQSFKWVPDDDAIQWYKDVAKLVITRK